MKTDLYRKRIVGIEKVPNVPEARLLNLECGHNCVVFDTRPPEEVHCNLCAKEATNARRRVPRRQD